jgi:hypothetical protein
LFLYGKTDEKLRTGASKNKKITVDKLGPVLTAIAHKDFSPAEVKELFSQRFVTMPPHCTVLRLSNVALIISDLDGSKTIEFREFLIAIAVGYFLKVGFAHTRALHVVTQCGVVCLD